MPVISVLAGEGASAQAAPAARGASARPARVGVRMRASCLVAIRCASGRARKSGVTDATRTREQGRWRAGFVPSEAIIKLRRLTSINPDQPRDFYSEERQEWSGIARVCFAAVPAVLRYRRGAP